MSNACSILYMYNYECTVRLNSLPFYSQTCTLCFVGYASRSGSSLHTKMDISHLMILPFPRGPIWSWAAFNALRCSRLSIRARERHGCRLEHGAATYSAVALLNYSGSSRVRSAPHSCLAQSPLFHGPGFWFQSVAESFPRSSNFRLKQCERWITNMTRATLRARGPTSDSIRPIRSPTEAYRSFLHLSRDPPIQKTWLISRRLFSRQT